MNRSRAPTTSRAGPSNQQPSAFIDLTLSSDDEPAPPSKSKPTILEISSDEDEPITNKGTQLAQQWIASQKLDERARETARRRSLNARTSPITNKTSTSGTHSLCVSLKAHSLEARLLFQEILHLVPLIMSPRLVTNVHLPNNDLQETRSPQFLQQRPKILQVVNLQLLRNYRLVQHRRAAFNLPHHPPGHLSLQIGLRAMPPQPEAPYHPWYPGKALKHNSTNSSPLRQQQSHQHHLRRRRHQAIQI